MIKQVARKQNLSSSLIGQRLIESGLLTEAQLKEALFLQQETALLLGEICLLKGWIEYDSLKAILPKIRSKVGERLIAHGYINMQQLWLAILEQRHTGEKLGEILVARGWVDHSAVDFVMNNGNTAISNGRSKTSAKSLR